MTNKELVKQLEDLRRQVDKLSDKIHEIVCEIDDSYLEDTYDSVDGGLNDLDTSMIGELD